MKKKLLCLLFVLIMVCSVLPASIAAEKFDESAVYGMAFDIATPVSGEKPNTSTTSIQNPLYKLYEPYRGETCFRYYPLQAYNSKDDTGSPLVWKVEWMDMSTGYVMGSNEKFVEGKQYRVSVYVVFHNTYKAADKNLEAYVNNELADASYVAGYTHDGVDVPAKLKVSKTFTCVKGVTTYEELKAALEAPGDATVTLGANISHTVKYAHCMEGYDKGTAPDDYEIFYGIYGREELHEYYETMDPTINVVGNKTLNLNGYNITVDDNRNVYMYGFYEEYNVFYGQYNYYLKNSNCFNDTLIIVPVDASLTIDDTKGIGTTDGAIRYNGYMLDVPEGDDTIYNTQTVRDIVTVYGEMTVNGGILEAGRSKKQYVSDGCLDVEIVGIGKGLYPTDSFDGYAYQQTWGSAVSVKAGGKFTTFGG